MEIIEFYFLGVLMFRLSDKFRYIRDYEQACVMMRHRPMPTSIGRDISGIIRQYIVTLSANELVLVSTRMIAWLGLYGVKQLQCNDDAYCKIRKHAFMDKLQYNGSISSPISCKLLCAVVHTMIGDSFGHDVWVCNDRVISIMIGRKNRYVFRSINIVFIKQYLVVNVTGILPLNYDGHMMNPENYLVKKYYDAD